MAVLPVPAGPLQGAALAAGVQFKVLGQVFPVLRHEVIRPISNASLAAAMLRHTPERPAADGEHRQDDLIGDLEGMLTESTAEVRRLGDWLEDAGGTLTLADLLELSRKLVFTQLLRSGKQIHLPERCSPSVLPEFSSRYVVLAWLLCLLDAMPDGGELRIEALGDGELRGHPNAMRTDDPPAAGISTHECAALASRYGWQADCAGPVWSLRLPAH